MKKQKFFILLASLITAYIPLKATSKQEIFIAKLNAESQKSALRKELDEKQRIEQGKQYEAESREKQRVSAQKRGAQERLEKQERELQMNIVRQLENTTDTDDNSFAGESIPVLD